MDDAPQTQQLFTTLFSPHHSVCGLMPHFLHTAHAWLTGRIFNFLVSFLTLPVTTESEGWTNRAELNLLPSQRRRGWYSLHLTDAGAQEMNEEVDIYFGCLVWHTRYQIFLRAKMGAVCNKPQTLLCSPSIIGAVSLNITITGQHSLYAAEGYPTSTIRGKLTPYTLLKRTQ